jgi:glycerol-3-phosphate dehydrogenase
MIRMGLFLYDHLSRRSLLPGSHAIRLDSGPYGSGLRPELRHGFTYYDCRVDDARLVVANAIDARARGARILTRTECVCAHRRDGAWRVRLSSGEEIVARALVNAAGPWVKQVLNERLAQPSQDAVRLVKGSHIVLPRLYEGEHAFILQNDDRRVVFMIPYEEGFTLVGTTDVPETDAARGSATEAEVEYLCRAVNRYLAKRASPAEVVWRYWGVRPLYDDGSADPSAITRDYTLRVDDLEGKAPVLSVFGGKITTYRSLAEHAMAKLARYFPEAKHPWTGSSPLPGSDLSDREKARREIFERYRTVAPAVLHAVFRRHGTRTREVLGDGVTGRDYGAGLTEREVRYFLDQEWAASAEDVLWRRTKAGLHLDERQRARVAEAIGR